VDLPSTPELNEFNRTLLVIAQLSQPGDSCSIRPIIDLCSSLTFGGYPVDHYKSLRLCQYARLLSMTKGKVKLTELGRQFLDCNSTNSYEITERQKQFVAEQLVFYGPWQPRARAVLKNFSPNYDKVTYDINLDENPLPTRYNSIIHLLQMLGVLYRTDSTLCVEPTYVTTVRWLRGTNTGMSEDELDRALQANMKLAEQAEEAVLEYERERLGSMGCHAEASLVRRVSQLNVNAGYDIESFDGDKPLFDYDRFIEVKSSYGSELRFFWSENERRVAEKKGDKYWIYFIGGLSSKQAREITPILIRNPVERLGQVPDISIKVVTHLIEQIDEIELKEFCQGKARGFLL